ncbi:MAG: glycoside hydrolase family 88 protein [Anaerolineae bacterium]
MLSHPTRQATQLQHVREQLLERVTAHIDAFDRCFPAIGHDHHYWLTVNNTWMAAFWPGILWLTYASTGDARVRERAESLLPLFRERLERRVHISHDLGFLYTLSARAQWQLTGDQGARDLGLAAAALLAERFNPRGQYIQAWGNLGDPQESKRTIIDSAMNVHLLFWAADQEPNPDYRRIARAHMETLQRHLVRPDGSTYHTYLFDPETGAPLGPRTHQGYADDSLWARGQAWAIYGFATAAEWCPETSFLDTARRAAQRLLDELPDDGIPYWDLRLPPHAPHHRDSSAGAIAAAGMLRLARLAKGAEGVYWYTQAERLLLALIQHCLDTHPEAQGFLREGAAHVPGGWGVGGYLIYGDYFFLESLQFYHGEGPDLWGPGT